jgi:heptosyltransferase I
LKNKNRFRFFDRYLGVPILLFLAFIFKKKKRLPIENIKNILILKFAAIGDTILMIPMLKNLRENFPDADITFACSPINYDVVKRIPYIDKIVNRNVHSFLLKPFKFIGFVKELRKVRYDILIDAGQWERINAIVVAFLKYDYAIGYKTWRQFKHFLFDYIVYHKKYKHELENFLDLIVPLGIHLNNKNKKFEFFTSREEIEFGEKFFLENNLNDNKVICLHPGCGPNGRPREWGIENYISLANNLLSEDKNYFFLISGALADSSTSAKIANGIKFNKINVTGKYSLDRFIGILKKVDLLVCSNNGVMHIASSMGVRTMGLYGPTNALKWGVYNSDSIVMKSDKYCSPCLYLGHDYGCRRPDCMKYIKVSDVFESVVRNFRYKTACKKTN